jgi:hypothetical protein
MEMILAFFLAPKQSLNFLFPAPPDRVLLVKLLQNQPVLPVLLILLSNLIPLYGIVFLGWNLAVLLILYWLESAVFGFYAVLKMLITPGGPKKLFLIPFFFLHFGGFMFGHLLAIVTFLVDFFKVEGLDPNQLKFYLLAAFLSHGASFLINFVGKMEYQRSSVEKEALAPYLRIVLMQITIVIGAVLHLTLKFDSNAILILLIMAKTSADLFSHLSQHKGPNYITAAT